MHCELVLNKPAQTSEVSTPLYFGQRLVSGYTLTVCLDTALAVKPAQLNLRRLRKSRPRFIEMTPFGEDGMIARRLIVAAAVALLLITGCASDGGLLANLGSDQEAQRPNIVVIMTDDQDLLLESMEYMPLVEKLLTRKGTTFSTAIVSLPLCCPARAMALRGEYPHNNGIMTNLWPTGGFAKAYATGLERDTVATALQSAGYRTALIGKYLNGYPLKDQPTYIPPGWDRWWAPITDTAYGSYDYDVNHDGQIESYGSAPEGVYGGIHAYNLGQDHLIQLLFRLHALFGIHLNMPPFLSNPSAL